MKLSSRRYDLPAPLVDLAKRRTEFLLPLLANFDVPIRTALASAYAQGMKDTLDVAGVFNEKKAK